MIIKTLTWHSLTYILGITSSVAMHQVIPSPHLAARFLPDADAIATVTSQIANRPVKGDRLLIKQATPQLDDSGPLRVPAQIAPNGTFNAGCKSPVDVPGRCFAD